MDEAHVVYLGLGGNLGNREENLKQALQNLNRFGKVEEVSSCFETEPVGYVDQPDFLNLVCRMTSELSPHELLRALKSLEEEMGRRASFRNAPRPIDVDILLFDDLVVETPELIIPHPRIHERAFVLAPLAEIAPELVHSTLKLTMRELLDRVDCRGVKPFLDANTLLPRWPGRA